MLDDGLWNATWTAHTVEGITSLPSKRHGCFPNCGKMMKDGEQVYRIIMCWCACLLYIVDNGVVSCFFISLNTMLGYIMIIVYIFFEHEQHQGDLGTNSHQNACFGYHSKLSTTGYPGCLALHRTDLALQLLRWQCHPDTSGEGIHETLAKVASMNKPETGISVGFKKSEPKTKEMLVLFLGMLCFGDVQVVL